MKVCFGQRGVFDERAAATSADLNQSGFVWPEALIAAFTSRASSGRSRTENTGPSASLFGNRGRPIFFAIQKRVYVYKKCLTKRSFLSTKSRAPKRGFKPFQESARTCLERLVTKHTRLQPGRAKKRLAMNAQAQQGAGKRLSRSLKIERTGDFFRKKIIPRIRLNGKWLEAAGFKPGHRVEICIPESGTMVLRYVEQAQNAEVLR